MGAAIRIATPSPRVYPDSVKRSATGIKIATRYPSTSETEAIVTLGSKEGLAHLALATTGVGDAILVPNPSYPIHPYGFVISGADLRHVPMQSEDGFLEELESAIRNTYPKPKCWC